MKLTTQILMLMTAILYQTASADDFVSIRTTGGVLGGVANPTDVSLSGGGGAFSQRLLVGISGNAGPTIFYGGGIPLTTTEANSTSIGGGKIYTSGIISSGAGIAINGDQSNYLNFLTTNATSPGNWQLGSDLSANGFYLWSHSPAHYVWKVDKTSRQTIIAGTDPGITPAAGEVRIGGGKLLANGAIGIGAVPDARLTIQDTSYNGTSAISIKNAAGVTKAYIGTTAAIGTAPVDALRIRGDGGISMGVNGQMAMSIDANNINMTPLAGTVVVSSAVAATPVGPGKAAIGGGVILASAPSASGYAQTMLYDEQAVGGGFVGLTKRGSTAPGNMGLPNGSTELVSYKANLGIFTFGGAHPLSFGTNNTEAMRIDGNGNIGIGTTAPTNKLTVVGTISAKEVKVTATGADYVFEDSYHLRSLSEVAAFIKEHRHLPEIPSAKAMQEDGLGLSEMVVKQLAKIEELTLYAIEANKKELANRAEQTALREEQEKLRKENADLKARIGAIENALRDKGFTSK